jgi:hypothetical protein
LYHLGNHIIKIHLLPDGVAFLNHGADAANDVARPASIRHDVSQDFANLFESNIAPINKTLARGRVTNDS